jgi:hypothetical protein
MMKHKAGAMLRFLSHPGMVQVTAVQVKPSLKERIAILCGKPIIMHKIEPHPELVDLGGGAYFGHPKTVADAQEEVKQLQRSQARR